MELDEEVYETIRRLCAEGDQFLTQGSPELAVQKYEDAPELMYEPVEQ